MLVDQWPDSAWGSLIEGHEFRCLLVKTGILQKTCILNLSSPICSIRNLKTCRLLLVTTNVNRISHPRESAGSCSVLMGKPLAASCKPPQAFPREHRKGVPRMLNEICCTAQRFDSLAGLKCVFYRQLINVKCFLVSILSNYFPAFMFGFWRRRWLGYTHLAPPIPTSALQGWWMAVLLLLSCIFCSAVKFHCLGLI